MYHYFEKQQHCNLKTAKTYDRFGGQRQPLVTQAVSSVKICKGGGGVLQGLQVESLGFSKFGQFKIHQFNFTDPHLILPLGLTVTIIIYMDVIYHQFELKSNLFFLLPSTHSNSFSSFQVLIQHSLPPRSACRSRFDSKDASSVEEQFSSIQQRIRI